MIHSSPFRAFFNKLSFSYNRNYKNKRQDQNNTSIVLYDHDCPMCRREMQRLKSMDHKGRLNLINIYSSEFDENYWGVSQQQASESLHVLTAERIWLVGMPAIRHVYSQVGQGWYMAPSGWPLISRLSDLAYAYLASNRYVVSRWLGLEKENRRCNDNRCTMKSELKNP